MIVPEVDTPNDNIVPRVRIYDAANDGTYWFRAIGFNRTITDD
jgi:hypothetical protein